jgi:hypothetical protein
MPAALGASLPLSLSPEARLLLLTAGGPQNDPAIRTLVAGPLDWGKLFWLAESEKATTVLWRRCAPMLTGPIPEAAAPLHRMARISEFRSHQAEQRLREVVDLLGRTGTDLMLLKGAALATTVYRKFSERSMSDFDLLVPAQRALPTYELLLRTGWKVGQSDGVAPRYDAHHHLAPLIDGRGTGLRLEIHTGLFFEGHPFRLSTESFWGNARTVTVGSQTVFVPDQLRLLLHATLHFAWSHMLEFGTWRTFRDVHAIVDAGMDWDAFADLALQSRGGTSAYWTLRLAHALSGFPAPPSVLQRLRPHRPEVVLRRIEHHFAHVMLRTENTCPSVRLGRKVWEIAFEPGRSGHGGSRPWDHDHDFASAAPAPNNGTPRFQRGLADLRQWARYGRTVLLGAGAAPHA